MLLLQRAELFCKLEQMSREALGNFELMVLLAVLRVGEEAYGVPIALELEDKCGRDVLLGSVYAALDRLATKGLVTSRIGDSTPERGGRAKTYFKLTAKGLREVRDTQRTLVKLWHGLPELQGGTT
jgi:PadR family transcriptional regulator PadR